MELDETDRILLGALRQDGRASMTALAELAHISRAGTYARVKRLTDEGVITGYGARVDAVAAGMHSTAYVALTIDQASWQAVSDRLAEIEEVEHMALVGGDFDVLLLVRARDNRDLRRVVLEDIQSIENVRATRTIVVFEDFPRPSAGAPRG
ncbi:Lrp/AsnC family transcriptional regulator [Rathayibacter sp. YIM 133350]|uniref:Lrp/AsnC family transcriptional regulator n=1 Tax=Rathayibacter sp. YIM 133350 TaxID=3131992 RepID=UPI00307D2870